jgi:Vitamin K-dependent gamma-carboxylase
VEPVISNGTTPLGAVGRFFFTPNDPTTLGFMRIMTGLLLLYTHAAYIPDLKEFFGPNAWWDHQQANKQRREAPYVPTPLGWTEFIPTLRVDDVSHRRAAEIEWLRGLPLDKTERHAKLQYLQWFISKSAREQAEGLNLANSAARLIDSAQDVQVRKILASDPFDDAKSPVHFPEFVRNLNTQDRQALWDDLLKFNASLPPDPEKQEYILTWLGNHNGERWLRLYKFLVGDLQVDGQDRSLPDDPGEREEFLDFLGIWGGDTRQAKKKGTAAFSVWYHITETPTMWLVHCICLVIFLLFTLGLFTRTTSVLAWAASLNYIHRSQLILFGQDTMQTILITYLMIGPSGATLSLDALRKRYRAARALMGSGGKPVPWAESALAGPEPSWLANFAVRLLQINFCFIYMSSGVSKLKGTTWWEHSAAWLVMANPEFGLVRYHAYDWMLRMLADNRLLISVLAAFVSLFTLVTEIGFPFLIWTRLRPAFIVLSVFLHFGIAIIMGLTGFGLYMYAMVLCYFPAKLIRDRVAWSPGAGRKMSLRFDSRDPTAVRKASIVRSLDVAQQVTFVDTAGKTSVDATIHLTDPDSRQVTGEDLFRTGLRELVLLRPMRGLGSIPGAWNLVNAWFGR